MATPTLTQEEYKRIQDANKKLPEKIVEKISYITKDLGRKTLGLGESIAFILMVILYFTFTGLAILFKRKIPTFWEEMARPIEAGRISSKIEEHKKNVELKKKAGKMRVVDLETGQSIVH